MANSLESNDDIVPNQRAILDTTIQLDRRKTAARKQKLDAILERFDWIFSTGISLVEFKATIIQECLTIHNQLRRTGARFTWVRDALLEKQGRQISLRSHIFNNLVQTYGSSFELTEYADLRLAEKARLALETVIPELYHWFRNESVDVILNDRLACDRSYEPPKKKRAAFEVNIPDCKRGKNKTCHVEDVIRMDGRDLLDALRPVIAESEQLQRSERVFLKVLDNAETELSHGDCRSAGDCLIALEAKDKATHAVSTNAREWAPLSEVLKFAFVQVEYPEEKTRS